MDNPRIVTIEFAALEGTRPRTAGCNARLGLHGQTVRVPIARITTDDGAQGFGASTATVSQASAALGRSLDDLWDDSGGSHALARALDFPLWDLMAKRAGLPVYALASQMAGVTPPKELHAPCYDTSLYFDDLHLSDDEQAAALMADEAKQGLARGHRAFKIKVGRGAMHMPLEAGMHRDAAVVHAVRQEVGPDAPIMLDANNGLNLNLTKRLLTETAGCDVHWMEEAFHEDRVLYSDLKAWIRAEGLQTRIADGEGDASPALLAWAEERLIDVVQYDIISHSFTAWLALGRQLDKLGVSSAPHHYGRHYGNYASGHLAAPVLGFAFVEWDEAATPGLDASRYAVDDGTVTIPREPGFGLSLDDDIFDEAATRNGYRLTWT